MSRKKSTHIALCAALGAFGGLGWGGAVRAQDHTVIGAGVAATPAYQGADDYRILPVPVIDIKKGRYFVNLRNGIGIEPFASQSITVGASVVFVPGYRRRDVPAGIDKLSSGAGARVFANLRTGGLFATVGAVAPVSGGARGVVVDAILSYPILVTPRMRIIPALGASWADGRYNDSYFGVSGREAAASGLSVFTAKGGFKDVSATLTSAYSLTDRVTLSATTGVTSVVGELQDSPIVTKSVQPLGVVTMTYRF
jgi:outer membrane protein